MATPRLAEFSFKHSKADSPTRGVFFYYEYLREFEAKSGTARNQIKFFCFRCDTKRTKSKHFAFVPIIRGPNQNLLPWSQSFWIKYKRSNLPETTFRPNQTALFRPRIFEPQRKWSGCEKTFFYQIKMFCFRSDTKRTKSKRFAFVPIISEPNQNLSLRSSSFWTKKKCSTLPKTISRPNQNVLLSFQ